MKRKSYLLSWPSSAVDQAYEKSYEVITTYDQEVPSLETSGPDTGNTKIECQLISSLKFSNIQVCEFGSICYRWLAFNVYKHPKWSLPWRRLGLGCSWAASLLRACGYCFARVFGMEASTCTCLEGSWETADFLHLYGNHIHLEHMC